MNGKLNIFDVDQTLTDSSMIFMKRKSAIFKAIAKKHNITINDAKELVETNKLTLPKEKQSTMAYKMESVGFLRDDFYKILDSVRQKGFISRNDFCKTTLDILKKQGFTLATYSNSSIKTTNETLEMLDESDKHGPKPILQIVSNEEEQNEAIIKIINDFP